MKRSHLLILLIMLLLVMLYLVSLGYGLAKGDPNRPVSSITGGFTSTLQGMLGGFTPRLDGSRLDCNNQRLDESFRLTQASPRCVIDLAPAKPDNETYSKGTLSIVQSGPKPLVIYVRSAKSDTDSTGNVDIPCRPDITGVLPRLEVIYEPDNGNSGDKCWIEQKLTASERDEGKTFPDVGIVVMQEDRQPTLTLTLICNGCQATEHTMWLKWK